MFRGWNSDTNLQRRVLEYAIKFAFTASNNEVEYEALIIGLQLCLTGGVRRVKVKSDSQLVAGHVKGEFEAKEDKMRMYLAKVRDIASKFLEFQLDHFPRPGNNTVDALSRLASTVNSLKPRVITREVLPQPSINATISMILDRGDTWMDQITKHLTDGSLPQDEKQAERFSHSGPS